MNPRLARPDTSNELEAVEKSGYAAVAAPRPALELAEREGPSPAEMLLSIWRERRFVAKAFVLGLVVAAVYSLLVRPEYESTTRLLPPEKQGLGGLAAMLATAGSGDDKASSLVGGFVSDAIGIKTSGALLVGILKSSTAQDLVVNQFNLRSVYGKRYQKDARIELGHNTDIDEDRKSGIISVTVTDRSPQRAMEIARAYSNILGSLTNRLDTSSAHKERVFLEERLKQVKQDLDNAAKALSDFSSKNLTLDVKEQGKAMVSGAAVLEGQLIAAESQLSGMEQIYTSNNVRVRSMQARVDELKRKLGELRGTSAPPVDGDAARNGDFGISISQLPVLGLTYYDLYRQAKIQETVFETLTKQYELAKIEEAKSVPTIKVLDEAQLPEQKSSPKRTLITLGGAILATLFAMTYVVGSLHWQNMRVSHPLGLLSFEIREGVRRDLEKVRARAEPWLRIVSRMRGRADHSDSDSPS